MTVAESGWDRRRKLLLSEYERIALELFAARGFRTVTFDDIADVAGVAGRTLFRYFPSKEEFLLSFPRRGIAAVVEMISGLPPSETPVETAWSEMCDAYLAVPPDVELLTLWRRAAADAPEVHARVRGERFQALMDALSTYCARSLGVDPATDARPHVLAGIVAGAEMAVVESWGRSDMTLSEILDAAQLVYRNFTIIGGNVMAWNYDLFVDGAWTRDDAVGVIDVIDPATEEVIGSVPEASTKTAVRAIEAARRAFDEGPWPWMKPSERAAKLVRMAEILESRADALRELIIAETGSTGFLTDMIQGAGSIGMLRSNASIVEHTFEWVENGPPTGGGTGMAGSAIVREPIGVVAAITPFNFPFMLNIVKVAPALAVGCTVVLKPHAWTPLDAMMIAEAAADADIPPGVLNVITGSGDVGDELTSNPMVDMVTFTGSTATGRRIMASAADTVKKLQLELGGKSAQVVLGDVSEDYARSIGFGMVLAHCGQGCVLQTRVLLPERLLDAYKEGLEAIRPMITIGDPRDETTVLGPLIREQQRARVEGYVQSGLDEGAELLCGGRRPDGIDKGFFYEPTVFVSDNGLRIAQEEIFGPVLTVVPYSGEDDDAVRLANDSIYGLGGGVVSASTSRAFNVGRRIRAGSISVQGVGAEPLASTGPGAGQGPGWGTTPKGIGQAGAFGGYKQSGLGREWGRHGLEDFTEVKQITWG